jgi:hypothetical protein
MTTFRLMSENDVGLSFSLIAVSHFDHVRELATNSIDACQGLLRFACRRRLRIGRFRGDFRWFHSGFSVSADIAGLFARF